MQRDKRGRFVRKAQTGSSLSSDKYVTINGYKYKVKPGATQAYASFQSAFPNMDDWLKTDEGWPYLERVDISSKPSLNLQPLTVPTLNGGLNKTTPYNQMQVEFNNPFETANKTKYTYKDGQRVDVNGNAISAMDFMQNPKNYEYDFGEIPTLPKTVSNITTSVDQKESVITEPSTGMTVSEYEPDRKSKNKLNFTPIDKTKLANFLEYTRAGIGASVNNKIADRALKAEKPLYQDVSESHRQIYGDYRSQVEGEKAAAKLRNMASTPLTSDGALQQDMMLKAHIQGQEYIDKGNAQDDAMRRQTAEVAWQQEKENQQQRHAGAMQDRQAGLMTLKNKSQIENMRDSANYSQVLAPLMAAGEQRLRSKGKEQEQYQEYYDDALVSSDVWDNYREGFTPSQLALLKEWQTGGKPDWTAYVTENEQRYQDWKGVIKAMEQETIRRKAAIKGVVPNSIKNSSVNNPHAFWEPSPLFKYGGTVYKAKLTKRSKDKDRGARSIESSKKIAARFLEKALDSLYDYKDVELIAKPKHRRKYQAGGGLPFVNFTPVFATSETGVPQETKSAKETKKKDDLTNADILKLLGDLDGLPSDIDAIRVSLANFSLEEELNPNKIQSSAAITSRYMDVLAKIKKAKANREWFDKAYDKLSKDGALNELAVDSLGRFIGMNDSGDFEQFTAKQVADGEVGDYSLLTNSNLLDIRARYPNAAFKSELIMEAANGVSMNQITEHINKVIQDLGSNKNETQVFGDQSKEVLEGLRQLQQAAQQVGQDLSISDLYQARVFTEEQAAQSQAALKYLYQTMPTNMKALLFAKTGSEEGATEVIKNLVDSKLSKTTKLEFSPKNKPKEGTSTSKKSGNVLLDGLSLSPAQMLQHGFGEREPVFIQNTSSGGLHVEAITMPITTGKEGKPVGAATLEDISTSQYGGILNFSNASMGGNVIPFEGRRNIAVDGSKLYSMYLPIDQDKFTTTGDIVPDIDLIDKVNTINKQIRERQITNPIEINQMYEDAGLPVYLNEDGTVVPQNYRRFGVLNGTAIDNAFGQKFVESNYLQEIEDEDIINGAIAIMNQGRSKEDRVEYDPKSFFNFGGALGDYDAVYQGTIFIPMSNDVFLGIAGSGSTVNSTEALDLYEKQQQKQRVSATYKNPGQL